MGVEIQERDNSIFWDIARHGLLSQRHVWRRYFPGKTKRAVQKRMSKLYHADFLQRATLQLPGGRRVVVYWLGWRGILHIAGQMGVEVASPKNDGENQMRRLEGRLREKGVRWLREPHRGKVAHDLKVVDVHWAMQRAATEVPTLTLEEWIPEATFRSQMDTVHYEVRGSDGKMRRGKRGVVPDGYFSIANEERRARGKLYRVRFLLEVDMASHSNPTFGNKKVAPYAVYVSSEAFKARFGSDRGYWLVVTTGRRRMRHLMRRTRLVAGEAADLFYFTTADLLETTNPLLDPIWWQVGGDDLVVLFPDVQRATPPKTHTRAHPG